MLVEYFRRRRLRETHRASSDECAMVCDRLALALASGLTVVSAMEVVARSGSDCVSAYFRDAKQSIDAGTTVTEALENLGEAGGSDCRLIVTVLQAIHLTGVTTSTELRRIGSELREHSRRRRAEAARRAAVTSLLPLAMCVLPAFAVLVIVPSVVVSVSQMSL